MAGSVPWLVIFRDDQGELRKLVPINPFWRPDTLEHDGRTYRYTGQDGHVLVYCTDVPSAEAPTGVPKFVRITEWVESGQGMAFGFNAELVDEATVTYRRTDTSATIWRGAVPPVITVTEGTMSKPAYATGSGDVPEYRYAR